MNIPALSVAMSASSLKMDMGTALLSKVLDTAEVAGEVISEMMEEAVIPGLGENIDIRI